MPGPDHEDRPYRSHLRPACIQCRRRKSRCKLEGGSPTCLMCRVHNTECLFPAVSQGQEGRVKKAGVRRKREGEEQEEKEKDEKKKRSLLSSERHQQMQQQQQQQRQQMMPITTLPALAPQIIGEGMPPAVVPQPQQQQLVSMPISQIDSLVQQPQQSQSQAQAQPQPQPQPLPTFYPDLKPHSDLPPGSGPMTALTNPSSATDSSTTTTNKQTLMLEEEEDGGNAHIIGPDVTRDSQVLADYLAMLHPSTGIMRVIKPQASAQSGPVIFAKVKKQPLGMVVSASPSAKKLKIVEKLMEPWNMQLIELFFRKQNICLPILDENAFLRQFREGKERLSPALICCIYAQSLAYWGAQPEFRSHHRPDPPFMWNLASEALFSELHNSPGISTVVALVLNVGGRPTTSMLGNQVQLGCAVSLAHSLGLNRSPMSWDIGEAEKGLRMRIWWALRITDGWSSLGYGTPPHLRKSQSDVPPPSLDYLMIDDSSSPCDRDAAYVFMVLFSLTELLYRYLDQVYTLDQDPATQEQQQWALAQDLERWVDSLTGHCRKIIIRGTELDTPGAANLRLAYLSLRLLTQRISLLGGDNNKLKMAVSTINTKSIPSASTTATAGSLRDRYVASRRTAEDIVLFAQELSEPQLSDFWQPVSAFTFASTVTFLLRCALEIDAPVTPAGASLSNSTSLRMAQDLLRALRGHREQYGWDLADIPLAQHTEVIEKLVNGRKTMVMEDVGVVGGGGGGGGGVANGKQEEEEETEMVMPFNAGMAFDWPNVFPESSFFNSFAPPMGGWEGVFDGGGGRGGGWM